MVLFDQLIIHWVLLHMRTFKFLYKCYCHLLIWVFWLIYIHPNNLFPGRYIYTPTTEISPFSQGYAVLTDTVSLQNVRVDFNQGSIRFYQSILIVWSAVLTRVEVSALFIPCNLECFFCMLFYFNFPIC